MCNSVFLISTASQALFLYHNRTVVENSILIITAASKKDINNIFKTLKPLGWQRTLVWHIPGGNNISSYWRIIKLRFKIWRLKETYTNIEKVFLGSFNNIYHKAVAAEFEKKAKIFLLYDGLQVITVSDYRLGNVRYTKKYPKFHELLGYKTPNFEMVHYVTPFPLNVKEDDSITVKDIAHQDYKNKEVLENDIFFIGQPLVEVNFVSKQDYLKFLKLIINDYSHSHFTYIPHPRETNENLQEISAITRVQRYDVIFEEFYKNSEVVPGKIISFYSSVLLNLYYFGAETELISYEIPHGSILSARYIQNINPVYNFFRNIQGSNFKMRQLGLNKS